MENEIKKRIVKFLMQGLENDYIYFDEIEYVGEEINTSEDVADKLIERYFKENKH